MTCNNCELSKEELKQLFNELVDNNLNNKSIDAVDIDFIFCDGTKSRFNLINKHCKGGLNERL